ncbi:hypothetical protein D3C76_1271380 [compost metagenome]
MQVHPGNAGQPLVQLVDPLLQLPRHLIHADFFQQRQACLQCAGAQHVGAATLEASRAARRLPLSALEVTQVFEHMPAIGVEPEART